MKRRIGYLNKKEQKVIESFVKFVEEVEKSLHKMIKDAGET